MCIIKFIKIPREKHSSYNNAKAKLHFSSLSIRCLESVYIFMYGYKKTLTPKNISFLKLVLCMSLKVSPTTEQNSDSFTKVPVLSYVIIFLM